MRYLLRLLVCLLLPISSFAALPPITGIRVICTGSFETLFNTTPGGTWSSSNPSIATVSSSGGVYTGVSAGTANITYTLLPDIEVVTVTVNPLPSAISGSSSLCVGASTSLGVTPSGGTWISSSTGVVSVSPSTGIVTGVSVGTAIISYVSTLGCARTLPVTVNPLPSPITGVSTLCLSGTTTLTSSAGGIWASTNPAVATVNATTGLVTANGVGVTTISYVLSTGCARTFNVTVNTTPPAIIGAGTVCVGATSTLSTSATGGTWSSSTPSVATVGTSGVVNGLALGTAIISHTLPACGAATRTVTVNSTCTGTPFIGPITASSLLVCLGTPVVLNLPSYTYTCGNIIQWQFSSDGLSWSNISGAATVPYVHYPTGAYFYRAAITCATGGSTAYSGPIFVNVNYEIGTHTILHTPDTACGSSRFYVAACGVSSSFSLVTFYGDGTNDTTGLITTGSLSDVYLNHTYAMPGTYTLRHILFNGPFPVDTVSYSYTYNFCRTFSMRFYNDVNSNCTFDAGDFHNATAVTTRVDSAGIPVDTIVATAGFYYRATGPVGTVYAFRPIAYDGGAMVTCPSAGVLFDTITIYANTYIDKYFGLRCSSTPYDLRVETSTTSARNLQQLNITVRNTGCGPAPAVLTLNHNPKYAYGVLGAYSYPAPSTVSGSILTWNLGTMAPGAIYNINLRLQRPSTLLPLGDTVLTTISVSPTTGDANPVNNTNVKLDTVRASYDPNDLAVTPSGFILPCTELQYRVRFENMGNDTARNIHVIDTLPDYLDPSSLKPIVASHNPMIVSVINDGVRNIARFDFPGINLPDTSHRGFADGMFIFSIKANSTVPDGVVITNRVGIFFDDNEVVMTNEVHNTTGLGPITGPDAVCLTLPDTLFNSVQGGAWSSSTPVVGTVSVQGIVTGIAAGSTIISYTLSNTCTSRTVTHAISVEPIVAAAVSAYTSSGGTVCTGSPVSFSAVPTAGGSSPSYVWSVNGVAVDTGVVFSYAPLHSDVVVLSMLSSATCAIPAAAADTTIMSVLPTGTPTAIVSPTPGDTSCAGVPVTYVATPFMGGSTPVYNWFVNSVNVGSGLSYTYMPNDADVVYCRMASNYLCRLVDTVSSPSITMQVDSLYVPSVDIVAAPGLLVAVGDVVTFTAVVSGAGPSPRYQWYVNGFAVSGATNASFASATLADYDSVTCNVIGSGVCSIGAFESVRISVWPVSVSGVSSTQGVAVFPNPNVGSMNIVGKVSSYSNDAKIVITNILGQTVYTQPVDVSNGAINAHVNLPAHIQSGTYLLRLFSGSNSQLFKFVLQR